MCDARRTAVLSIATLLAFGIGYSILYDTYLDTSNPLLAHLPHPLSETHIFASKKNFINVLFVKKAWGWTSVAFFLNWLASPPQFRTRQRFSQFLLATASWLVFTTWFFGPALLERALVASGGECVLHVPTGGHVVVPHELCYSKSTIHPTSHPELFVNNAFSIPDGWNGIPRLRRGHDVSGHVFLLTLSILFLVDQLRPFFNTRREGQCSAFQYAVVVANSILIAIWYFSVYTTSVYYHSPLEKITGFALGLFCFALTQLPFIQIRYKTHTN